MACKLRSLSQNSDRCIKVAAAYLVLCIMYDVLCVLGIVLYVLILYIVLYTICYMPYVVLYVIYHIDISYIILRCIKVAAAYLALCVQVSRGPGHCESRVIHRREVIAVLSRHVSTKREQRLSSLMPPPPRSHVERRPQVCVACVNVRTYTCICMHAYMYVCM